MSNPQGEFYGYVARFETTGQLMHAAEKVRDAGFKNWDVYTPFPVHGMDDAMGLPRSRVPLFTLTGGVIGFFSGMLMAWYMGSYDYPLIVGGKPFFSPIFPFPVAYELTILLAAFGTIGGMFLMNLLPRHNHPIMNYSAFERITDDYLCIAIENVDPKFERQKTRAFLEQIGGKDIEEVYDDPEEVSSKEGVQS
jgi:hypothetical protein